MTEEEMIDILKKQIEDAEDFETRFNLEELNFVTEGKQRIEAMKNLLERYKEEKDINQELRQDIYAYHQLMKMKDEREYRSKFLKDFQNVYGDYTLPDYDTIYKQYDKMKKALEQIREADIKNISARKLNKLIDKALEIE